MIYTELTKKSMKIAYDAYLDRVDPADITDMKIDIIISKSTNLCNVR